MRSIFSSKVKSPSSAAVRFVCQITWSGGDAPIVTRHVRISSVGLLDAFDEMTALEGIEEPDAPPFVRTRTMIMIEATQAEWDDALAWGETNERP